jgi:hypothetical protein
MASEDFEMSEQGTTGKRKCVTLTVPHEPEIIRGLESGKYQIVVVSSCIIGSSAVCDMKKQKDQ